MGYGLNVKADNIIFTTISTDEDQRSSDGNTVLISSVGPVGSTYMFPSAEMEPVERFFSLSLPSLGQMSTMEDRNVLILKGIDENEVYYEIVCSEISEKGLSEEGNNKKDSKKKKKSKKK